MECHWRIAFENSENGTGLFFFLIEFSIFSRINFAAKIFPLPTSHTHHTLSLPLHSSLFPLPLFPSLCATKWNIHETFKDDQISSYRTERWHRRHPINLNTCLIACCKKSLLAWLQRIGGKDAGSLQCLIPAATEIQQPDWIPSLTAYTHTFHLTLTLTHTHTFSRRNACACGGACYTLEACMNYLQT